MTNIEQVMIFAQLDVETIGMLASSVGAIVLTHQDHPEMDTLEPEVKTAMLKLGNNLLMALMIKGVSEGAASPLEDLMEASQQNSNLPDISGLTDILKGLDKEAGDDDKR